VSALQVLSGVPELVALTWLVVAGVWLLSFIQGQPSRWQITGRTIGIVLLVTGLTAAQMLPFFDLLAHSQRDRGFVGTKWPMPGWGWANFLLPLFHCFETPQGQFFQYGQEFLSSYYLGIGLFVLAIMAAWRVRQKQVWLLAGLTLFSLIMALGENGSLYRWLKNFVPLLGIARYPVKYVFLAAFAVPLLAAYAIRFLDDRATSNRDSTHRYLWLSYALTSLLMAVMLREARAHPLAYDQWDVTWRNGLVRMILLLGFFVALHLRNKLVQPIGLIVVSVGLLITQALDIITSTATQNPTIPASTFEPGIWQSSFPFAPPKHGQGRVMISPDAEKVLNSNSVRDPVQQFIGKRLALWSNLNLLENIPKVNGSSTLQVREQMLVQNTIYATTNNPCTGLLDFLGVSLVTTPGKIVEWSPRETWLPLATIGSRPLFTDATNALAGILAPGFDPRHEVILPAAAQSLVAVTNQTMARITSRRHRANRIDLEIQAEQRTLIVLAQSYYHCWHGSIDGRSVPVWRANFAFQAFEVPAGQHRVQLVYRDWKFYTGAIVSLSSLCFCLIIYFRKRN
ncbi:MAG TPA: YfhO family protein, partial [Gemmataceae bacterium]|nr:YfhO family protein [Gemmataceae bacterium]